MSIRRPTGTKYALFREGVDNTSVIDSEDVQNTLSVALNAVIYDDSLVVKRPGYTSVNTAWSTRRIRQGFAYTAVDGSTVNLVYGEDSAGGGYTGRLGKMNGSGSVTDILTGLKDGVKPTILQFRTQAYIFNGDSNFLYNGTTTKQIGITKPTSVSAFISNGTGHLNAGGTYLITYTYYNSQTGAESTPADPSAIMGAGTNGAITASCAAGDSTTADTIKVYRTVDGGDTFFFDHNEAITATSFTCSIADASLTTELELDNSQLPQAAKYAILQDNRIFVAGFASNPNRIQYSKIGINGSMPESFQALDIVDCNINDGDKIIGLETVNSTVIVFKQRSVGRLLRIQALTGGIERTGSAKYLYEEISKDVTCVPGTMINIGPAVMWLGKEDIYGTDGGQIYRQGKRIRNTIKSLNFTQSYKFSSINKIDTLQVIISCVSQDQTEPDFQLVGHYRNFPTIAWTFYSPGTDRNTWPGIPIGSIWRTLVNNQSVYYVGSSKANGYVYQLDSGNSDNGSGIYFDVRLPWNGAQNPASKKVFHSYYLMAGGGGATPNNTLTHTFEVDGVESIIKTETDTLPGSNPYWNTNSLAWAAFNWYTVQYTPMRFYPHQRAYFGRYGFNNTYADQPVAVKALTGILQMTPIHR